MTTLDDMIAQDKRYNDYIIRRQDAAKNIPFGPGKVFSIVVGDCHVWYEVVDSDDKTATVGILWPEDEADDDIIDCVDAFIGSGGTFDRGRIEALTSRQDKISSIFGSK